MSNDIREGYGLVISVKGGDCFAVACDGRYVRFRVSGAPPRPGEIVRIPAVASPPVIRSGIVRLALAATLVLAIGMGAVLIALQRYTAAYVAIDINPSLELALNYPGRVVGVNALNPDAVVVLDRLAGGRHALLGLNAREALAEVIRAAIEQGFLPAGEENVIQVTVVGSGRGIPAPEALRDEAAAVLDGKGAQAYLRVRSAGPAARNEARKQRVSVNALLLAEEMAREGMAPEDIGKAGAANIFKASELAGRRKGQEGVPQGTGAAPRRSESPEGLGDRGPETGPGHSGKSTPAHGKPVEGTNPAKGTAVPGDTGIPGHGHADDGVPGQGGTEPSQSPEPSQTPSTPRPPQPPGRREGDRPGQPSGQPDEGRPEQPEVEQPEQLDKEAKGGGDSGRDTPGNDESKSGDRDKKKGKPGD